MENSSEVIRFTPFKHSDAGRYWCKACSGNVTNICGWINLTTGKLGICSFVCVMCYLCSVCVCACACVCVSVCVCACASM